MRHRKAVKKLGRTAAHRKATLSNLAAALFQWKHIKTTEAKAKAARRYTEKLITLAKKDTTHARRLAFAKLRQKKIVKILFDEIAHQYIDRDGGYTRVIKIGQRPGDGAHMAVLELIGYDMASKKKKEKDKEKDKEKSGKSATKKRKKEEPEESGVSKSAGGETEKTTPKKKVDKKKEKTDKEIKEDKSSKKKKK